MSTHEHSTVPARAGSTESAFAARLSPLLARAGVVPTPAVLLSYQGRLGLTDGELVYVLHVLSHKREAAWPWVDVGTVASAKARHERNVRSIKESLVAKKLLLCRRRMTAAGRGADEHDLTPLFARLEALAVEDARSAAIEGWPEPSYFDGQLSLVDAPTPQRLQVRHRGVPGEIARYRGSPAKSPGRSPAKSPGTSPAKSPGRSPAKSPGETDVHNRRTQQTSVSRRSSGRDVAARPDETDTESNRERSTDPGETTRPELTDEGIGYMVENYVATLGDNDPRRTAIVCTTLWRASGLEAWEFHNAMKEAAHRTTAAAKTRELANPAAYWQTSLASCVDDRRAARGLVEASA